MYVHLAGSVGDTPVVKLKIIIHRILRKALLPKPP